jgi:hypothetical protein
MEIPYDLPCCRLQTDLACDDMPTHTRFVCRYNEEDDELSSAGQMFVSMTLQVVNLRMICQLAM